MIEENDPWLATACRAAGLAVEAKDDAIFRFGELNVDRVRRILARDSSPEPVPPRGRPPELCAGCPHRSSFEVLKELDCIVSGDIGCYTLAALPPIAAMDMMIDMGAAVGMGLGLRHVLPRDQAKRVVSVIGDSTFLHGGLPGLVEMAYNPPADRPCAGHPRQRHDRHDGPAGASRAPAASSTARRPTRSVTRRMARAAGVKNVVTLNPIREKARFKDLLAEALRKDELTVFIARSPCILAAGRIVAWQKERKASAAEAAGACGPDCTCGECPGGADDAGRRGCRGGIAECRRWIGKAGCSDSATMSAAVHADEPESIPPSMSASPASAAPASSRRPISLPTSCSASGHTVKKAEVHGMSQRGGSVQSDVRFGDEVHSPMIPDGACDFLVVLEPSQVDVVRGGLRPGGVLLTPADIRRGEPADGQGAQRRHARAAEPAF